MVTFVVQGVRYRVHRYFFARDSQYFRELFLQYLSKSNHIEFPARIKTSDFDAFLSILYPMTFEQSELSTATEWTFVLRLSTEWCFASIRARAIEMLEPLASPVDKIVLGNDLSLDHWIAPGYVALCARPEPLTLAKAEQLQMKDIIAITTIREIILRSGQQATEEDVAGHVSWWINPTGLASDGSASAPATEDTVVPPASIPLSVIPTGVYGIARDVHRLTEENFEPVSKELVAWANMHPDERRKSGQPTDSFCDLVESILHRGVTDPRFMGIGTRFLERLIHEIAYSVHEYRGGRCQQVQGPKLVREDLQSATQLVLKRRFDINAANYPLNRILYGELPLASETYNMCGHNATIFVAKLLKSDLVSQDVAYECLEALADLLTQESGPNGGRARGRSLRRSFLS